MVPYQPNTINPRSSDCLLMDWMVPTAGLPCFRTRRKYNLRMIFQGDDHRAMRSFGEQA